MILTLILSPTWRAAPSASTLPSFRISRFTVRPSEAPSTSFTFCMNCAYTAPHDVPSEDFSTVSVFIPSPVRVALTYPVPAADFGSSSFEPSTFITGTCFSDNVTASALPFMKAYTASTLFRGVSHPCVRFDWRSHRCISLIVVTSSGVTACSASMTAVCVGMR